MKDNVLILSKRYSSDSQLLYNFAINNSWKVWRFVSPEIPEWVRNSRASIYCETSIAEYLASELKIELLKPHDDILAKLPFDFVKRKIEYTTYKNFKRPDVIKFIKPADYKYFTAGVYNPEDIIPGLLSCQADDPILMSDIVKFISEFRLYVLNHEIVTGSIYISKSEFVGDQVIDSLLSNELLEFASAVASALKTTMPNSYVLDIGQLDSGEYAVIEFNPVWASGFYGSDLKKVLTCIQSSCVPY